MGAREVLRQQSHLRTYRAAARWNHRHFGRGMFTAWRRHRRVIPVEALQQDEQERPICHVGFKLMSPF